MGPENTNNQNGFDNSTQNDFSAGSSLNNQVNQAPEQRVFTDSNYRDQSRIRSVMGGGFSRRPSVREELDRISAPVTPPTPKKHLNIKAIFICVVIVFVLLGGGLSAWMIVKNSGGRTLSKEEALPILEEFYKGYSAYANKYDNILGGNSLYYNSSFVLFQIPEAQLHSIEVDSDIDEYEEFKNIKTIKGLDSDHSKLFKEAKKEIVTYIDNSHAYLSAVRDIYDAFIDPLVNHYYNGEIKTCDKSEKMNTLLNSDSEEIKKIAEKYYSYYCNILTNYPVAFSKDELAQKAYHDASDAMKTLYESYTPVNNNSLDKLTEIINYMTTKENQ